MSDRDALTVAAENYRRATNQHDRLEALNELAAAALAEHADSTWLIERGQPEKQVPTVWRSEDGTWTEDANRAQRFASREAAETVIEAHSPIPDWRDRIGRAAEHVFLGERTA